MGSGGALVRGSWLTCNFWTLFSTDLRPWLFCFMKSLGELEVTIVIGLCWGESETKLITSTVSELLHWSRSVLMKDEFLGSRLFACSKIWTGLGLLVSTLCRIGMVLQLCWCVWLAAVVFFSGFPQSPFVVLGVVLLLYLSDRCPFWMVLVVTCPIGTLLVDFWPFPLVLFSLFVFVYLNRIV